MGKDLKGKELGKGLGQRKDKYYYAKYSYHGKKGQQRLPDDPERHGERLRWFYHPSNLYDDGHIFQECQR